jgi:hypothetical protein
VLGSLTSSEVNEQCRKPTALESFLSSSAAKDGRCSSLSTLGRVSHSISVVIVFENMLCDKTLSGASPPLHWFQRMVNRRSHGVTCSAYCCTTLSSQRHVRSEATQAQKYSDDGQQATNDYSEDYGNG